MRYLFVVSIVVIAGVLSAPGALSAQERMRAVTVREGGGPAVLEVGEVPRPVPGEGEILVRVHAAGVNPVDTMYRSRGPRGEGPYVPGFDVSGVVAGLGPGVNSFAEGDEVFGMIHLSRGGGYAEYAILKEGENAPKPSNISHVEAAGLPLVSLTAWQVLFDTAGLEEGESLLVHAAAGGVGTIAVQFAAWKGASPIWGTASERNHAFLREIGVDVPIDYRTTRFEEIVDDADVVLNAVDSETGTRSLEVLAEGGIVVSIAGRVSQERARALGVRAESILVQPDADQLRQIARLIEEGHIRPIVTHVFSLAEADEAHRQSETRHTRGKIVLQIVP